MLAAVMVSGAFANAIHAQEPAAGSPVDLSRKAIRAAVARSVMEPGVVPPRVRIVRQDGSRVDTIDRGRKLSLSLLIGGLMLAAGSIGPWADSTDQGNGCDAFDTYTCRTARNIGIGLTTAGLGLAIGGWLTRPGPSGDRVAIGPTGLSQARTQVTNRSRHPMEVSFEGPADRTVVIQPNSSQTIELEPGQYRQTVRVVGSDALPFLSLQVYEAGMAYREGYYVRK